MSPTKGATPIYALGRSKEEHERLTRQAALLGPMTERLFREAGLEAGMRVLDIGSGVGDVAFLAAELVGPRGLVVGVDVDGAALDTARKRAELLGLRNVRFVERDARSARFEEEFDGAVGRLVLMYVDDPTATLVDISASVRPGGVIAFQEIDADPTVRSHSFPAVSAWDETGWVAAETFARAGTHTRMGRQLFGAFLAAGLQSPAMREEALVGGGPDFPGYAWLAEIVQSLSPLMERLGVASARDLRLETLAARMRSDAVASGAVVWSPPFVGAYATKPKR